MKNQEKICPHCGEPVVGRRPQAIYHKDCQIKAEARRYQQKNKERLAAYHREYYRRRKELGLTFPSAEASYQREYRASRR